MLTQWNESLWGDESFSALAVMKSFTEMFSVVMKDTAPPGFYFLGWIWVRIAGSSEVALRSLTLMLMIGAAVFAGMTVYKFRQSKITAFLTTLLAFGAPFLVPFAFEWRMYALLCFSVMGSVYFFLTKKWGWYIGFTLLALYTHHFGLFTFASQGMWFAVASFSWKEPRKWLSQLWPFLIVVLLYLPWVPLMYQQLTRVKGGGFWLSVPTLLEGKELMYRFVTGGIQVEWKFPVLLGGVALLATKDWRRVRRDWWGLLFIYLFPVLASFVVSYFVTPIFYDRYLLSVVMGMMVLLIAGNESDYWPIILILVLAFWWQSWRGFIHPSKKPFREMAAYVRSEIREGDALINWNGKAHHLWESKYYRVGGPIYTTRPLPLYVGTAQMKEEDVIMELPKPKGRLGVIASEDISEIELPGFQLIKEMEFGELSITWWRGKK